MSDQPILPDSVAELKDGTYRPFPKKIFNFPELIPEPPDGYKASLNKTSGHSKWSNKHKSWICEWDGMILRETNLIEFQACLDYKWYKFWKSQDNG